MYRTRMIRQRERREPTGSRSRQEHVVRPVWQHVDRPVSWSLPMGRSSMRGTERLREVWTMRFEDVRRLLSMKCCAK